MKMILKESIDSCKAYESGLNPQRRTTCIYPFATENIGGYIGEFNLENKSLLTVGSSGDQVINAALYNCHDLTLLDVVPDTMHYYYLKVAALLTLPKDEFMEFFKYYSHNDQEYNHNTFNIESYRKLRDTLKVLNNDAFEYFDTLFSKFDGETIRVNLFQRDEESKKVIETINPYLSSNILYEEAKERIKDINPNFMCMDIFKFSSDRKFDNIWLSNIATWQSNFNSVIKLVERIYPSLNDEGKILLSYLYSSGINASYDQTRAPIYNYEEVKEKLKDYNPNIKEFDSMLSYSGDRFIDVKDSIITLSRSRKAN